VEHDVSDTGGESACWLDLVDDDGRITTRSDAAADSRNVQPMRWLYVSFDVPEEAAEAAAEFWPAVLGWQLGEPWEGHPEFRSLRPPNGDMYAHVQRVEGPVAVHFDLGVDDVGAGAARLVALGATQVSDFGIWRVMRSPGGLAFCLVPSEGESVPASSEWPDGHRSRLVQLCIDSPADLHDAEVAFWRAATGWRYETSVLEEYGGKLFPPSPAPVRLLFQRLGADDRATATRVHIDLGTDDIPAEVDRVEQLGARRSPYGGEGWVQLVDPNGLPFCVTRIPPD
jgi:predicted enzyme related to lactoylglutathione lyase